MEQNQLNRMPEKGKRKKEKHGDASSFSTPSNRERGGPRKKRSADPPWQQGEKRGKKKKKRSRTLSRCSIGLGKGGQKKSSSACRANLKKGNPRPSASESVVAEKKQSFTWRPEKKKKRKELDHRNFRKKKGR